MRRGRSTPALALCFAVPAVVSLADSWTWAGGSNRTDEASVYGEKMGVVSAYVHPSGRKNANSWIDTSRNRAYIFGGKGYGASDSYGHLNDLWWYDLNAEAGEGWTWVGGSNATDQVGVYGEMGVESASNMPVARWQAASWVDACRNRAYIFGGRGYGGSSDVVLNDLWWYDLNAVDGEGWTWAGGSNATDQVGVYGEMGSCRVSIEYAGCPLQCCFMGGRK
jgi:hypothetical protein